MHAISVGSGDRGVSLARRVANAHTAQTCMQIVAVMTGRISHCWITSSVCVCVCVCVCTCLGVDVRLCVDWCGDG